MWTPGRNPHHILLPRNAQRVSPWVDWTQRTDDIIRRAGTSTTPGLDAFQVEGIPETLPSNHVAPWQRVGLRDDASVCGRDRAPLLGRDRGNH